MKTKQEKETDVESLLDWVKLGRTDNDCIWITETVTKWQAQ